MNIEVQIVKIMDMVLEILKKIEGIEERLFLIEKYMNDSYKTYTNKGHLGRPGKGNKYKEMMPTNTIGRMIVTDNTKDSSDYLNTQVKRTIGRYRMNMRIQNRGFRIPFNINKCKKNTNRSFHAFHDKK